MHRNRFALYAWGVLGVNIFVILWGAVVRATGSGAGCGNHWPACNGEIIPLAEQTETIIEFTHRLTSGVALILVIGMVVWAVRKYPAGHRVRQGAYFALAFIIIEALIGAGLVIFELVASDSSAARAIVIALHLVNTLILLSALTLTAWWASGGAAVRMLGRGWPGMGLLIGYGLLMVLGASGSVTALGDTLFPANSLAEGLQQDFSPTAHYLTQLRIYHPLIAIMVGAYLVLVSRMYMGRYPSTQGRLFARSLTAIYGFQLLVGTVNVALLAPVWMQLFHLLMADVILIVYVLFLAAAFADELGISPTVEDIRSQAGDQAFGEA